MHIVSNVTSCNSGARCAAKHATARHCTPLRRRTAAPPDASSGRSCPRPLQHHILDHGNRASCASLGWESGSEERGARSGRTHMAKGVRSARRAPAGAGAGAGATIPGCVAPSSPRILRAEPAVRLGCTPGTTRSHGDPPCIETQLDDTREPTLEGGSECTQGAEFAPEFGTHHDWVQARAAVKQTYSREEKQRPREEPGAISDSGASRLTVSAMIGLSLASRRGETKTSPRQGPSRTEGTEK
ncbi:hypothetical protein DFH06DRAFT_1123729 [Mycena polygramma]|nr:hypothetical protein DFH06DRAFT_1123729 [Mycena polygramma]